MCFVKIDLIAAVTAFMRMVRAERKGGFCSRSLLARALLVLVLILVLVLARSSRQWVILSHLMSKIVWRIDCGSSRLMIFLKWGAYRRETCEDEGGWR